jgi:PAS domain S-box-containing protein
MRVFFREAFMKIQKKRGPGKASEKEGKRASSHVGQQSAPGYEQPTSTEALRRSEQKFENIFLNSLDVLLIIELDTGNIVSANNALVTVLGYAIEDVRGRHFSMLHAPETGAPPHDEVDPFSVHGAVFPAQKVVRADGSVIPMDLTAALIPWDDRTVVLATFRDASDREDALRALRESELRYRTLFDQASDAIILENDRREILDANRAACQMTGHARELLLGMKTSDLRPGREPEEPNLSETTLDMDAPFETVIVRSDGTEIPVELTVAPLVTNRARSFLSITRDITERKRAQEELRRAHDELEKRVQERTAELEALNERLLQEIGERTRAEVLLKESLGEKEVLLQEIHHRVKNNLQIISSLIALQSRQIDEERMVAVLNDSQNRIRSMALIHEQLYHSADLARIDFAGYLRNLSNTLLRSYADSAAAVTLKVEAEPVLLRVGTAIPCGLIVNELVSNCLKHAFPQGTKGEIRIGLSHSPEDRYTLLVADNGCGLPEDLDFRNSPSLGLRLITNLAESQLRGTLEIHSKPGVEVKIVFSDREQKRKHAHHPTADA